MTKLDSNFKIEDDDDIIMDFSTTIQSEIEIAYGVNDPNTVKTSDDKLLVFNRRGEFGKGYNVLESLFQTYFPDLDSAGNTNKNKCDFKMEPLKDIGKFLILLEDRNPVLSFCVSFDKKQYEKNIRINKNKSQWFLNMQKDSGIAGITVHELDSKQLELCYDNTDSLYHTRFKLLLKSIDTQTRIYFIARYYFITNQNSSFTPTEHYWLENETENLGQEILENLSLIDEVEKAGEKRNFSSFIASSSSKISEKTQKKQKLESNTTNDDNKKLEPELVKTFKSLFDHFYTKNKPNDQLVQLAKNLFEKIEDYTIYITPNIIGITIIDQLPFEFSNIKNSLLSSISDIFKKTSKNGPKSILTGWTQFLTFTYKRIMLDDALMEGRSISSYNRIVGLLTTTCTLLDKDMVSKSSISKTGINWEKITMKERGRICIIKNTEILIEEECYELKIGEDEKDDEKNALCIYTSTQAGTQFLSGLIYIVNLFTLEFERMLEKHILHNYKLFDNSTESDGFSTNSSRTNNMSFESRIIAFFLKYVNCREDYKLNSYNLGKIFASDESMNAGIIKQELDNNTQIENVQHFVGIITNLAITHIKTLANFKKISLKKNN